MAREVLTVCLPSLDVGVVRRAVAAVIAPHDHNADGRRRTACHRPAGAGATQVPHRRRAFMVTVSPPSRLDSKPILCKMPGRGVRET